MAETIKASLLMAQADQSMLLIAVFFAAMAIIYFASFECLLGQTIGKMLFRIYVESGDRKINVWQGIARSLFFIPLIPFSLIAIADPLFMMLTKNNQRLSEMISRT